MGIFFGSPSQCIGKLSPAFVPLTFPNRIRGLISGRWHWGYPEKNPMIDVLTPLFFEGSERRSWKINTLKEAMINRTGMWSTKIPWLALEIVREKIGGREWLSETGWFLFLDGPAWGYHTARFFFLSLSLSLSQTNQILSSGKVYGATGMSQIPQRHLSEAMLTQLPRSVFLCRPIGIGRIRWVPSLWKRSGNVESFQVGMVGKQSVFFYALIYTSTADDHLISVLRRFIESTLL